jgi:hypothetical protein
MLMLHSGRDEFSAGASHLGEELFTSLIDERDLLKVNDCAGQRRSVARVFPARTQLVHPGSREAPMQAPTLSVGCIGITDSKHIATPFRLPRKHPCCRCLHTHSQGLSRKRRPQSLPTYGHTAEISVYAEGVEVVKTADFSAHPSAPVWSRVNKEATANEGNPEFSVDLHRRQKCSVDDEVHQK